MGQASGSHQPGVPIAHGSLKLRRRPWCRQDERAWKIGLKGGRGGWGEDEK